MSEKNKNTEEVIPMIDAANKEVLDFSKKEDAEADRILYESQGLQADGVTPLGETPKEDPEKEKEDEVKKDLPEDKDREDPEKG